MATLENVKVGDKLLVTSRGNDEIKTVTKVTKTQVTCDTSKFRKTDGRLIGSDIWWSSYAKPATDEDIARVEREITYRMMANTIKSVDAYSLPYEELKRIYNILKEIEK